MTIEEKLQEATERVIHCAVFLEHKRAKELMNIPTIEQMEVDQIIQVALTVSSYVNDLSIDQIGGE